LIPAHGTPVNRSSHQSSDVTMPAHHIGLYALVVGKKQGNDEELQPHEDDRGGAE
jgi:hypothetical protein